MAAKNLESEIKIPVTDLEAVRANLRGIGAVMVQPMMRETNLLFDSNDRRLIGAGSLLRIREHGSTRLLTFKGPARFEGAVKEREELEIEISNPEVMGKVLDHLGYSAFLRYEKDREIWRFDEASVVLDHTPMGDFVEVEGQPECLERLAARLGLEVNDAVRSSYVSLWQEHRARHPELDLPSDMVFAE